MTSEVHTAGKVVFLANSSWYLWNFRARMAREIAGDGREIVFVAPRDDYSERLAAIGRFIEIKMNRKGKNPFAEFSTLLGIYKALGKEDEFALLTWTPKANIYGGIASRFLRCSFYPNISGLGTVFVNGGVLTGLVRLLYKFGIRHANRVFFQNTEDRDTLVKAGAVKRELSVLLPGSGVDTERFQPKPFPERSPIVFLFAGRLIKEKGIEVLVRATEMLKKQGRDLVVLVVGFIDSGNPSSISQNDLDQWESKGLIRALGRSDEIETLINSSHCVVHPSYYKEGRPRILMEAAACGRPVVTTDSTGCRDAVVDGKTGFLVEPRDADSLVNAMQAMIRMDSEQFMTMSSDSRKLALEEFDESSVFDAYREALSHDID